MSDAVLVRWHLLGDVMRYASFFSAAVLALCGYPTPASAQGTKDNTPPPGFTALFNGKDLTGWQAALSWKERTQLGKEERASRQKTRNEEMRPHWVAREGMLTYDGLAGNLETVKEFGDFELLIDWKISPQGDSGVYLRGLPQVQIWDSDRAPGARGEDKGAGSGGLWNNPPKGEGKVPLKKADKPVGQWNTFRIIMKGELVTVYLNGELVVDRAQLANYWAKGQPLPTMGPIELQHHTSLLWFKNIYIKELREGSVAGVAPQPTSGNAARPEDAVFSLLSDSYLHNGKLTSPVADPAALDRLKRGNDAAVRALAIDGMELLAARVGAKLAYDSWRRGATDPEEIQREVRATLAKRLLLPEAQQDRLPVEDIGAMFYDSSMLRLRMAGWLQSQLTKVQGPALLPVLKKRFPKASAEGGSVKLSVRIEPGKLPAEMTLENTGSTPIHNAVAWFYLDVAAPADLTQEEKNVLRFVDTMGASKYVSMVKTHRTLEVFVLALGSRNMIFVPVIHPKDKVRIKYELSAIRFCKKSGFSLFSEELKRVDQRIDGLANMQADFERMAGPRPK